MCLACEGLGRVSTIDVAQLVDVERSLNGGAIIVPNFTPDTSYWKGLAHSGLVDPDVKLKDYTPTRWEDFLHKPATKMRIGGMNTTYEGLVVKVQRLFLSKDRESMQPHIRAFVDRAVTFAGCPSCGGARLNPAALSSTIDGVNIAQCSAMQISDLAGFVRGIDDPSVGPLLATLRDKGNTVLVVEHKPEVIDIADHVVDLGPGAGPAGGAVCFTGDVAGLRRSDTLTGRHLDHRATLRTPVRQSRGQLSITGAAPAQPQGRERRPSARGAHGGDGRRRVGQELADPRLAPRPGRRDRGRPDRDPRVPPQQSG